MEVATVGFVLQSAPRHRAAQNPNLAVAMAALIICAPHKKLPILIGRSGFWRFPLSHVFSLLTTIETQDNPLPYFYEGLETPINDERFWDQFQEIWEFVCNDLMDVRFESEEAAIAKKFSDSQDPDDFRLDSLGVARYRDTDDRDNLLHFHGMGLDALGETEAAIDKREMSADFMRQWSILLSCHGFVAAAMMARGTDVQGKRAGRAGGKVVSVEAQQRWFSHYYLRERPNFKDRAATEQAVWRLINAITDGAISIPEKFPFSWFEKCLNLDDGPDENENYGQLTYAFRQTRLSEKKMKALVLEPTEDLPPLNLEVPRP